MAKQPSKPRNRKRTASKSKRGAKSPLKGKAKAETDAGGGVKESTGHQTSPSHHGLRHDLRHAILTSAGGLIFSALLSLLVVAGLSLDLAPARALERAGSDMTMRLFWAFAPSLKPTKTALPPMVFVDIDEAACIQYRPQAPESCRTAAPVPTKLIADFVEAMRGSEAAIVVIDIAPPEAEGEREVLRRALIASEGPWIIAPLYGRPAARADTLLFSGDPRRDLASGRMEGKLRLASFQTHSDPTAGDAVIRHYSILTEVRDPDGTSRSIPSAPYLASRLVSGDHDVDCYYTHRPCQNDAGAQSAARSFSAPVFFSYPSLAMQRPAAHRARLAYRYEGAYLRLEASKLLRAGGGRFASDPASFEGALVVLGSSSPAALDWLMTPIGPMSGPELLINATRSFAEFNSPESLRGEAHIRIDAGALLLRKLTSAAQGAFLLIGIWLLIYRLRAWGGSRGVVARVVGVAGATAIFIAAFVFIAFLEAQEIAQNASMSFFRGEPMDVVTPIVVLGLEFYADGASAFLRMIDKAFEPLLNRLVRTGPAIAHALSVMLRWSRDHVTKR